MKRTKRVKNLTGRINSLLLAVLSLSVLFTAACSEKTAEPRTAKENVSVTVFNGEHYKVKGENKKTVKRGENVAYEIALDEGYELVSSFGTECAIPPFKGSYSFTQIVQFTSVNYDTTITLQTRRLETTEFKTESNVDGCEVEVQTASGYTNNGEIYSDDIVNLYAIPAEGYRFHCWSTGNYLSAGGKYLSNEKIFNEFDFNSTSELYANFKSTADSARTIIYDFGEGVEIEQDCSAIVAHHYLANTLTEPDLKENGYELPQDKMLVGWETAEGEYVGLGSRTAVSDETFITLTPVWKQYADENDFIFSDGKITDYVGESKEVVIPNKIGGEEVTAIAENAFEECAAGTYYLPNTITSIEENAFLNCTALKTFYMSDNILDISDSCFRGCKNFETLHLNAYLKPRYLEYYSSTKTDVFDKIILDKDRNKCVLMGGSSVMYGYNISLCEELLPKNFTAYNLGYDYSMCGYAYYEIVNEFIKEGDIYVHAPEINCRSWGGFLGASLLTLETTFNIERPYLFYICEANWQLLSYINIKMYSNLFNMFASYNNLRQDIASNEYFDYCSDEMYSVSGEAILEENGEQGYYFLSPWYIVFDTPVIFVNRADEYIYKPLIKKGVNVCLAFSSINRHNLFLTYKSEENVKSEAEKYTQMLKNNISAEVNVLLMQYDTIYDGECFSDSDYHLGYPTRDIHTRKVMNALIEELNIS